MGLVDYSESESSDNELDPKANAATPTQKSKQTSKPTFQKVVDKSNPRKITVTLPDAVEQDVTNTAGLNGDDDGPPAKRARTGAFSGFNSFLPAPKNAGKPTSNGESSGDRLSSRGGGLGRGINLKTGSQPAFSRGPIEPEENIDDFGGQYEPTGEENVDTSPQDESREEKLPDVVQDSQPVVRKAMFKPLSVARKPDKKKKKKKKSPLPTNGNGVEIAKASTPRQELTETAPPKRSLFASTELETDTPSASADATQYQPYFDDDNAGDLPTEPTTTTSAAPIEPQRPTQKLDSLASSLNLTPSQRRQLFGRSGAPSDAQLTSFSVSQEYTHNQEMAASAEAQAAAQVKTVRSIAPGKHSLQQLINQASTQKDALEDSYAAGRQNKKAVGNRYGW